MLSLKVDSLQYGVGATPSDAKRDGIDRGVYTLLYWEVNTPAYPGLYLYSTVLIHGTVPYSHTIGPRYTCTVPCRTAQL
jgi:hypothetical protein